MLTSGNDLSYLQFNHVLVQFDQALAKLQAEGQDLSADKTLSKLFSALMTKKGELQAKGYDVVEIEKKVSLRQRTIQGSANEPSRTIELDVASLISGEQNYARFATQTWPYWFRR
jgi:hypothetical protein